MTAQRTPRVSVLTTVYNAAPFLTEAMDSLLAQTFTDWELVAVDDGSVDGSREMLQALTDPRIRVVLLPANVGRLHAVRHAFDLARGEFVAVLDADDVARADRLERQVALLDAHPEVSLVGSWARLIDESGRPLGAFHPPTEPDQLHELLGWANPMVHSSVMYRADAARAVGGYPLTMRHSHDCALWTRLAARGALAMIAEYLCDQRVVAASMTRGPRFRTDVVKDALLLTREAPALLRLRGRGARRNRDERLIAEVKWGVHLLQTGQRVAGAGVIVRAIATHPLGLLRSRAHRRQFLRSVDTR